MAGQDLPKVKVASSSLVARSNLCRVAGKARNPTNILKKLERAAGIEPA